MRKIKFTLSLSLLTLCLITTKAQQWGDYTLYSIQNSSAAYLCDTNGTNQHTWTFASTAKTGYSSYLMPGGILWRTVNNTNSTFSGGGMHGRIQKYDYSGTLLWDFIYSTSSYNLHHDICPMPNGNILLISYELKTAAEATAAGSSQNIVMWSEKIIEVQPTGATTGTIVWEWHVWDHLVQNVNSSKNNYQTSIVNHPELLNINYKTTKDWIHMNGIDYNPILDQIVVSSHNLNEWYIIDHSTTSQEAASHSGGNSGKGGDFLYRWGNPTAYGASGTTILNVTHDPHWIPEGVPNNGYLVGFNNKGVSSTQSSIDIVSPPTLPNYNYALTTGSAYAPSTYTSRIAVGAYSSNMGNSQHLPNGNTLICVATAGILKELSPTGSLLWSKTLTGSCAQSFRYDACYVNNPAPAIPIITEISGTLNATSASMYQWYMNGKLISGATSSTYTPTQSGIYIVRTTDSNGCLYEYSLGYHFSMSTYIVSNEPSIHFNIFPNPTTGLICIQDAYLSGRKFIVTISDAVGKIILNTENKNTIDLSNYENGVYYISVKPENAKTINTKIILTK